MACAQIGEDCRETNYVFKEIQFTESVSFISTVERPVFYSPIRQKIEREETIDEMLCLNQAGIFKYSDRVLIIEDAYEAKHGITFLIKESPNHAYYMLEMLDNGDFILRQNLGNSYSYVKLIRK